ncbi:MAG: hypothetical protein QOG26_887 [Solirubrobacterales bacterium]|nr:hypothetical protein [Solirubrobacterales bacterium]
MTPAAKPALDPEQAVGYLTELSADLRGCAILDSSGEVLAASGDRERWATATGALLEAADAAGQEPVEHLHVATEDGEVFAVREGERAIVAVTERFALASLMVFDMRTVLRDLGAGA